jgi:hypothetical protein
MMIRFLISLFCLSSLLHAADPASLFGKVMCGYQGWFATPTDGSNLGWVHYGFNKPGQCHIDLWPDVSELDADERFDTPLKLANGTKAQVYSSANPKTVKTTSDVPVGAEGFVTEPELKSDHYLWLTGMIGKALRREISLTPQAPVRH